MADKRLSWWRRVWCRIMHADHMSLLDTRPYTETWYCRKCQREWAEDLST